MTTYTRLLIDAVTKKYFQFKGRAGRREFFVLLILDKSLRLIAEISFIILGKNAFWLVIIISFILMFLSIPSITVTVRRLHDINLSGWWLFFGSLFCFFAGIVTYFANRQWASGFGIFLFVLFLVVMSIRGTNGSNKYGKQP